MEATQPRRSMRLVQRVNPLRPVRENSLSSPDDVSLPPSEERSGAGPSTQPPKKKAATSSSKPKRVKMRGKLSGLLSLPLDIFFEITSHLHPLDLLHLSRASRHFARMFLRMENRHAWLAARRSVEGLPDCPSDISEARYAHLLFESTCSGCGKIGRCLLFNLRVRFCASCYKANVETYMVVDGVEDYMDALISLVPHNYSVSDSSIIEYFEDEFQTVMDEFYKAQAIGLGDGFLSERHDAVLALIEHGDLVSNFLDELQERKEQEKTQLRVTRKLQIDARIMALGYTRNEIPEDSAMYQEEIRKPKALTERAWRGMSDKMDKLAASQREEIFAENRPVRFNEWISVYSGRYFRGRYLRGDWPNPLDAAHADAVLELLSEVNASIPFTLDRLNAHSERILADITAWKETAKRDIVDNLAEEYGMPKDPASLYHASAVICCGECEELLFASDVMNHLHGCNGEQMLWGERGWGYDVHLHQIARTLLHHAGLAFDIRSDHLDELEGVLRRGCTDMEDPTGFLELVAHLWQEDWLSGETFKLHKLRGGQLPCDNEALNDDCLSTAEAVVLLEMTEVVYRRSVEPPLQDDDPCCRLCGEACYMQVDMRSQAHAKWHMWRKHEKAEVLEEDLCPAKDIFRATQEYVDAHGGQIIVT